MGKTYKDSRNARRVYDKRQARREREVRERFENPQDYKDEDHVGCDVEGCCRPRPNRNQRNRW